MCCISKIRKETVAELRCGGAVVPQENDVQGQVSTKQPSLTCLTNTRYIPQGRVQRGGGSLRGPDPSPPFSAQGDFILLFYILNCDVRPIRFLKPKRRSLIAHLSCLCKSSPYGYARINFIPTYSDWRGYCQSAHWDSKSWMDLR